ncbi:hypothetical protein HZA86_02000, partial [Candidatus Uhrbacteria bacterium]|nr:hypothetical protein [Candidatus Uhrbacteria bacterium]
MKPSQKKMIVLTAEEALRLLADIIVAPYTARPSSRKYAYAYLRKHSIDRARFRKTLHYLISRGYVYDTVVGKQRYLEVTSRGRKVLDQPPLLIPTPKRWDQRWRIVLFDIPATYTKTRNYFREHLKDWGFLPMQRSVYVYPFDCHREVGQLIEFFKL